MSLKWTFPELITGRKFDLFQSGLEARFEAHRIVYRLTYGEPNAKPAMWMDFETGSAVGRVTLWETGECEFEVLDADSGDDLLRESHTFPNPAVFFENYPKVPKRVHAHTYGSRLEED